jgi:hypothetical protein
VDVKQHGGIPIFKHPAVSATILCDYSPLMEMGEYQAPANDIILHSAKIMLIHIPNIYKRCIF